MAITINGTNGLTTDNNALKFDTDVLVVDDTNNRVGIGESSPASKLEITAGGNSVGLLRLNESDAANLSGYMQFDSNGTNKANVQNANNAGIHVCVGTGGTVTFGALGYTAASALDDYEEGTFEPTLANDGSSTYSNRQGHYTKIGNVVTIQTKTTINTRSGGSGTTGIMNLPYAMRSSSPSQQTFHLVGNNGWDTDYGSSNITGYASAGGSIISFYYNSGQNLNGISIGDIGSNGEVYVSGSYITD